MTSLFNPFNMRRYFLISGLYIWFFAPVAGQSYRTAAGLRIGNDIALSISQRIVPESTIDLYHESGLFSQKNFTALAYKKHVPVITKRLNIFGGIGPYYQTRKYVVPNDEITSWYRSYGLLLSGGIDFTIGRLNVGYDIMPVVRLGGTDPAGRVSTSSALTLRYVIIKQPKPSKSWFKKKKKS